MKKLLTALMAAASLVPLAATAQDRGGDRGGRPEGRGPGGGWQQRGGPGGSQGGGFQQRQPDRAAEQPRSGGWQGRGPAEGGNWQQRRDPAQTGDWQRRDPPAQGGTWRQQPDRERGGNWQQRRDPAQGAGWTPRQPDRARPDGAPPAGGWQGRGPDAAPRPAPGGERPNWQGGRPDRGPAGAQYRRDTPRGGWWDGRNWQGGRGWTQQQRRDNARGWARSSADWRDMQGWYGQPGGWGDRRWSSDARQWDRGGWNRDWRRDSRYDWGGYRLRNRQAFHLPRYYAPYGWNDGYRRFSIGATLSDVLFAQDYWIGDPWAYRLPDADEPYRWVRYYNDALLVDVYSGEVVDVINDIFW